MPLNIKITTRTKMLDLDNYRIEDVDIDDIAHSLSQQCRYNGNTPVFYSVAEHTPYVARLTKQYILNNDAPYIEQWTEDDKAMCCLGAHAHDNPEQVTGDIIRPVKRHIEHFSEIEEVVTPVMEAAFGLELTPEMRQLIKRADDQMADLEQRYFFPWKALAKPSSDLRLTDFSGAHKPGLSIKAAKKLYLISFRKASSGKWMEL